MRPDPLWRLEKYLETLRQVEKVTQKLSPIRMEDKAQVGSLRPSGNISTAAHSDINRDVPDPLPEEYAPIF